jgi:hypothetical protein
MKNEFIKERLFNRFNFSLMHTKFNRLNESKIMPQQRRHTMKRLMKAVAAVALGFGLAAPLHAATTDSLTVTITPNAVYAIDIATDAIGLDLGTVSLGASTQTVRPSTVTVQSTYAQTDIKLQGSIASGGTPWTFDANTASQEANALAAWATLTTIAHSTAPAQTSGYFSGTVPGAVDSDVISASNQDAGDVGGGGENLFEAGSGDHGFKDLEDETPNEQSLIWLYFRLPSATTTTNAQNITITLTAGATN